MMTIDWDCYACGQRYVTRGLNLFHLGSVCPSPLCGRFNYLAQFVNRRYGAGPGERVRRVMDTLVAWADKSRDGADGADGEEVLREAERRIGLIISGDYDATPVTFGPKKVKPSLLTALFVAAVGEHDGMMCGCQKSNG